MIYDIYEDSLTAASGSNLKKKQDAKTIEKSYELIREKLGGRIKVFVCGGAALRPEVKQFLVRCWNTPMIDGYGSTETGNIAIGGRILPGVRVKLSRAPVRWGRGKADPEARGVSCQNEEHVPRLFQQQSQNGRCP